MIYLEDNGRKVFAAEQTEDFSHGVEFKLYEVTAWKLDHTPSDHDEVGVVSMKWDGCSHVGLRDPGLGSNWTHVCTADSFRLHLRALQWAWNLAVDALQAKGFKEEPGMLTRLEVES